MGSCDIPDLRVSSLFNGTAIELDTDLEIAEERVYEEVDDNKWRKDGVENAHEDESSLEPMRDEASASHADVTHVKSSAVRAHPCTRSFLFRSRTNSFLT
jgi:hypothetical protein